MGYEYPNPGGDMKKPRFKSDVCPGSLVVPIANEAIDAHQLLELMPSTPLAPTIADLDDLLVDALRVVGDEMTYIQIHAQREAQKAASRASQKGRRA